MILFIIEYSESDQTLSEYQILCAQKGSKFMSKKSRIRKRGIEQLEKRFAEVPCARGS
jgi:hypothetical protein